MTLYITSVSFEDRCLGLVTGLGRKGARRDGIAVFDFCGYENVDPYLANRARLMDEVRQKGYETNLISAGLGSPLAGAWGLERVMKELSPEKVVLDVSTLPRSYLFTVCKLLCEWGVDTRVRYYKPITYGGQLSRGVRGVGPVPGFEGGAAGAGNAVLVLILGFEGYKAVYAWEQLGASRTIALLGVPPYRPEFLDTARRNNGELFKQLDERVEVRDLHTFDIEIARRQLVELYEELVERDANANITVCPLGTKPQSVAAFALAYRRPEVGVACVSSRMYYTGEYSRGFDPEYVEVGLHELVGT